MATSGNDLKEKMEAKLTEADLTEFNGACLQAVAEAIYEWMSEDVVVDTNVTVPIGGILGVTPGSGVNSVVSTLTGTGGLS